MTHSHTPPNDSASQNETNGQANKKTEANAPKPKITKQTRKALPKTTHNFNHHPALPEEGVEERKRNIHVLKDMPHVSVRDVRESCLEIEENKARPLSKQSADTRAMINTKDIL